MCLNRLRGSANIDRFTTIIGTIPTITPTPTSTTLQQRLLLLPLPPLARQLLADVLQDLGIPPLADVLVALDPVAKGGLPEGLGPAIGAAGPERELDVVDDRARLPCLLVDAGPLLEHVVGHAAYAYCLELLEGRGAADYKSISKKKKLKKTRASYNDCHDRNYVVERQLHRWG